MNGIHDLGGMHGLGSIEIEADEPTFHEDWESTAFRLNIASVMSLFYNAGEYRHAIERMEPGHYLHASYYERVITGVATLLVEKGILDADELESLAGGRFPLAQPAQDNVDDGRSEPENPHYSIGQRVRVREIHPPGHTRVPRYVRGRIGVVVHIAPPFGYPDASAHGLPSRREPTYHVEFTATELWGKEAGASDSVVVDLWETYLEESS